MNTTHPGEEEKKELCSKALACQQDGMLMEFPTLCEKAAVPNLPLGACELRSRAQLMQSM